KDYVEKTNTGTDGVVRVEKVLLSRDKKNKNNRFLIIRSNEPPVNFYPHSNKTFKKRLLLQFTALRFWYYRPNTSRCCLIYSKFG
ncbi:MAG TPA: hypothetical protein VHO90_16580, partial [Bacteroidales bacterium]|nr:hypothetical protein [Bacteroidales bacterium]